MADQGYYGERKAKNYGLDRAPVLLSRLADHTPATLAATEVRCDKPTPRMTNPVPREDAYLVALQLRDFPHHEYWEEGRQTPVYDLHANETLLYDLKRDVAVHLDKPYHSIHFYIPRASLLATAEDMGGRPPGELRYDPGKGSADPIVTQLGRSLLPLFKKPEQASQLFIDHMMMALVTHVTRNYGDIRGELHLAKGGLAPWQERRAKELLNSHLGGGISLAAVAQECGLSPGHFTRAFRRSTGLTPHKWLQERRIEAAKVLIQKNVLSLTEVALACGFADQSHFTKVFASQEGRSPGAWRRNT